MAYRSRYQPHEPHTTCGVLAALHLGQTLRAGAFSCHALARRLRVFIFEVFFFGTAIVRSRSLHVDRIARVAFRVGR